MGNPSTFGRFITFEGGEGSGKSTQIQRLAIRLGQHPAMSGVDVVMTREPGGAPLSEQIRTLLVTGHPEGMDPKTELMLVMAARTEHVQKRLYPTLRRGGWVLCDRFADSTLAYQGYGRGMNRDHLTLFNRWATSGLTPDLTILLDIDPEIGLSRTEPRQEMNSQNSASEDRFERVGDTFHQQVNAGFRQLAKAEPKRFFQVDANQEADTLEALIWERVCGAFPNL
ncbi:MAG: dTMP kinase [Magnetococcales bacterium]|nr:dTMP kinase [Magnetococcales bacterium]